MRRGRCAAIAGGGRSGNLIEFAVVGQNLAAALTILEYGGDPGALGVGIKRSVYASLTFRK